jgi:glycine/D-amino acid oxidase-like deaminating enzyme
MNLYEQQPYWLMKNGIIASYPSLDKDLIVDVAVMGAGISAALSAWYLRSAGLKIAVVDRRHVALGSTAASTAFLQYEIDTPLTDLSNYVGEENAVKSYQLCREAIYVIRDICKKLKPVFDFHLVPSLQHASFKNHVAKLRQEFDLRKKHGFDVEWMEEKEIKNTFDFAAPAAIYSKDGGEVDAYKLTHALFADLKAYGHSVYNNTGVDDIAYSKSGVVLTTTSGLRIKARKLIIACGYESLQYVPKKIAAINSTYALVSEPLHEKYFWHKKSLIWETAVPYMYFRVASDNRILIGGRDDPYHHPHIHPSVIAKKTSQLVHAFCKKLPHIPLKPDFSWAGAFATTKDGLPYIGSIPERPNTFFALGFGGNGITFSVIAAEIIRDSILGKKNDNTGLFSFNR